MSGGPFSKGKGSDSGGWVMLIKCFGGPECLDFTLVFRRRSVPTGVICSFLYGRKESQGRDVKWNQSVNFCPCMDFFDWLVCFNFSGPQLLLC